LAFVGKPGGQIGGNGGLAAAPFGIHAEDRLHPSVSCLVLRVQHYRTLERARQALLIDLR
jgi:hypothetical protein